MAAPVFAGPYNGLGYYGGNVSYTTSPYGGKNGGGEFKLGGIGLTLPIDQYDSRTHSESENTFQTFCVERDEYIDQMDIWVSEQFVNDITQGSHAWGGGLNSPTINPTGDDLDPMTAWLYEQFATGQLDNYDFDNTSPDQRRNDAAGLQWAIWYIEDELYCDEYLADVPKAAYYYGLMDGLNLKGIGNVRVLQGYDGSCYKQDQLYYVPVPGAVLLGMLGLGAAGLKLRRFA